MRTTTALISFITLALMHACASPSAAHSDNMSESKYHCVVIGNFKDGVSGTLDADASQKQIAKARAEAIALGDVFESRLEGHVRRTQIFSTVAQQAITNPSAGCLLVEGAVTGYYGNYVASFEALSGRARDQRLSETLEKIGSRASRTDGTTSVQDSGFSVDIMIKDGVDQTVLDQFSIHRKRPNFGFNADKYRFIKDHIEAAADQAASRIVVSRR